MAIVAAIEAGGTKFVCALAEAPGAILAETRIPTTTPDETFARVAGFFAEAQAHYGQARAAGLASFGPLDLDPASASYGRLTTTPKAGWRGVDMLGRVREMIGGPCAIETDVAAAALAEGLVGAAQGLSRHAYVTVGTGLGVAVMHGERALVGAGHAEIGHIRVGRAPGDVAAFAGVCPYHGDCLEGLASGPAMAARWGAPAETLDPDHPAWAMEAFYLGQLCANLAYTVRPQRIVFGGGVFGQAGLLDLVRGAFAQATAGYALGPAEAEPKTYLAASATPAAAGLLGAIALARRLL